MTSASNITQLMITFVNTRKSGNPLHLLITLRQPCMISPKPVQQKSCPAANFIGQGYSDSSIGISVWCLTQKVYKRTIMQAIMFGLFCEPQCYPAISQNIRREDTRCLKLINKKTM